MSPLEPPSSIFHRNPVHKYPAASSGDGIYITAKDGSKTLDGSSGAAVSCLGHGHPAVIDAIVQQARQMAFAHTSFFTSGPAEELAALLVASGGEDAFKKCMFVSSGSEAVESALKVARQYHIANGKPNRVNIISRRHSYHGNTLGAMAAGWNPSRREPFAPMLSPVFHHVSPFFYSRDGRPDESADGYCQRMIDEFDEMFASLGPNTVAAVMVETASGATLGAVPATSQYLRRLRNLCHKHGALLILDEVMCGMGRLGRTHAWQAIGGSSPDIQTIGKGLGAGYQPISAVLVSPSVHNAIENAHGEHPFVTGHTYQGHSIGCAAALATQKYIEEQHLLQNVQRNGELLTKELASAVPGLKEVRGSGMFQAVEFQSTPDDPIAAKVAKACMKNGLAVYLCSPLVDAVLFAPPFIITECEIQLMVSIFVRSVTEVVVG
ncbi:uncharacterized protein LTR77_004013 [Saxophila tyrrhenica]|uniref:Aminotransferase n=1 Tax=Saxophila tyrrhenica TaxID=1690608 RepID=A0AAV9PJJ6_9PEZI|nr:hypothetical protein LTR77_004013 [Saxophila tyrrhenica]